MVLTVAPKISPSPSFGECRQRAGRGWDRSIGSWSQGRGNRIVRHPQRYGGDTKGDVGGGGAVVELGGVTESLKGQARIGRLAGSRYRPRLILDGAGFALLFLKLVELCHLKAQSRGRAELHPGS